MKKTIPLLVVAALAAGYVFRERLIGYAPDWVAAYAAKVDPALAAKTGAVKLARAPDGAGPARVAPPVAVSVATATTGRLPVIRSTIGTVIAVDSTQLAPEISGTVAKILVPDGAEVKQGDLLIQLDDRTIRAQIAKDEAQIAKDQASVESAQDTYNRTQPLVTSGVATAQSGVDALAALKVAQGTLAVDKAAYAVDQVALSNTQIRAPYDGRLSAVQFSPGAFVAAGTPLVRITQMKPVQVEFSLPSSDLPLLRQSKAAGTLSVTVSPTLSTAGGGPLEKGSVNFIDNLIAANSATVTMRASLANSEEGLWPGQPVNVSAQAGETEPLVLVPNVAVMPHTGGSVVYVVGAEDKVESRPVTVALRYGETAGISAGLKAGDQVIVEGQSSVLPGGKVKVIAPKNGAGKPGEKQGQADLNPGGAVVTKS